MHDLNLKVNCLCIKSPNQDRGIVMRRQSRHARLSGKAEDCKSFFRVQISVSPDQQKTQIPTFAPPPKGYRQPFPSIVPPPH